MTKEEQIKQKAEAEADKVIIGSGMDRTSVIHLKHLLVTMYIQGATKVTKELQKENAELKSENQKWKDEWQEQVQKATDEGYARTLQTIQLTKAKELLKEFVHHYKAKTIYVENMQDLLEQSEQFLKDSEVENGREQKTS